MSRVSLALQAEGGVTPAHTADHVDHAQLYRRIVVGVQLLPLQLHLQDDVPGGGGVSLVQINTAIAS